jgi:pyruvate dehydrogenase E1 component
MIGATAGRTTLTGEGLQHADGHSPIIAATNTGVITYDPAYGYEIGHIIKAGIERMYGGNHVDPNVIYYITVYNEPIVQPVEPAGVDVDGILKGIHRISVGAESTKKAQILASGVAVPWAYEAQQLLLDDWNVSADIWSVTSWSELRRNALACDEQKFLYPSESAPLPYLTTKLAGSPGPFLGVSDYMHQVPDQIRKWIPGEYATLGADGFGFSDTRAAARRAFKIDGPSIVVRVLEQLASRGEVAAHIPQMAIDRYRLLDVAAGTSGASGGDA